MSKEVVINVKAVTEGAQKDIKKVKEQVQSTNKATTELSGAFDKATGGMVTKTKGVITSVKNLGSGFIAAGKQSKTMAQVVKTAMASTGIGLLVVAVGTLISYFTQTQRGADKVKQAFAGISAAVSVIIDRVSGLGEAVTKVFSGDFSGALESVRQQFKGINEEIANEAKAAVDLEKQFQSLRDEEISLITVNAQRRKGIDEARLAAEDETLSIQKRIEALDTAAELENAILADQLRIAQERARISSEQLALGESSRAEIEENARLQAQVAELESQSLRQQRSIATRRNALVKQGAAEQQAALKAEWDARTELNKAVEVVNNKNYQSTAARVKAETQLISKGMEQNLKIYQSGKKKEVAIEKATSEQKMALAGQTLGMIAGLLGENSKAGKAAAIAQATINTYEGITAVLKNETTIPEPFGTIQKIVSAGTVLASGLQAVRQIQAQPLPQVRIAGGFGGGGGGSVAPSSPPSFNVVGASPESQLAQAVSGKANQPVKAYVVAGEVTTAQSLERNKINEASI